MSLLGESVITRRRYDIGSWVAGRWSGQPGVDHRFKASVQEASGKQRQVLTENDRQRHAVTVLTQRCGFLRTVDQHTTELADEIVYAGRLWRLTHAWPDHPLISHEVFLAVEVQEAAASPPTGTTLRQLEDGVRAWLVQFGALGGVPNADRAVVIADENAPRPPFPYASVRVLVYDIPQASRDEWYANDSDQLITRAERSGTVSLNGFGEEAAVWLERAISTLSQPSACEFLDPLGFNLEAIDGERNLSALRDTDVEPRFQRDLRLSYTLITDPADADTVVPVETIETTSTFQSETGDRVIVDTQDIT